MRPLKPVLKWVGGKRQLLDSILPFIPAQAPLYAEPFVGGRPSCPPTVASDRR